MDLNNVLAEKMHHFNGSFREAAWPFLMVGQCFGIMPVIGIRSLSSADLKFSWTSLRTVYSVIIAFILTSYSLVLIVGSISATDKLLSINGLFSFL